VKDLTELGQRKYAPVLETVSASEMIEFAYAIYSPTDKLGYDSSISNVIALFLTYSISTQNEFHSICLFE
jgi:hypothetical protein